MKNKKWKMKNEKWKMKNEKYWKDGTWKDEISKLVEFVLNRFFSFYINWGGS